MSKPSISVRNLGKRYLLGVGGGERYRAFRDVITNSLMSLFKRKHRQEGVQELWALRNISFDVEKGQKIGIIGKNGAGKTTLLKLLSEITEPTEGEIRLRGRVASLLEVGTGFHPELTGKENIFMNGAILGMTKAEIKRRYDEIVAFAEVEKFLDTPVKRYSTGMQMRLAFAVAAHLESEILLIDEVLAVGDVGFRKKCMGKMEDVASKGRTVLVVSHNMPAVVNLCERAILLDTGRVVVDGQSKDVVQHYLATVRSTSGEVVWSNLARAPGNDTVRLQSVHIFQDGIEGPTADVDISKEVRIQITYRNLRPGTLLYIAIILKDQMGTLVFSSSNHKSMSLTEDPWYGRPQPIGFFQSVCRIPGNFLNEGFYSISAIVGKFPAEAQIFENNVLSFQVHDTGEMRKEFYGGWAGTVRPRLPWHTKYIESNKSDTQVMEHTK